MRPFSFAKAGVILAPPTRAMQSQIKATVTDGQGNRTVEHFRFFPGNRDLAWLRQHAKVLK